MHLYKFYNFKGSIAISLKEPNES